MFENLNKPELLKRQNEQPKPRKRRRHKGLIDYPTLCIKIITAKARRGAGLGGIFNGKTT